MKKLALVIASLLLAGTFGCSSDIEGGGETTAPIETTADVTEAEETTAPETEAPAPAIPELPFYEKGDLNAEVLPGLFEGKTTYTDVESGLGNNFGMHFVDFIKVGDKYRAYYIRWNGDKGGVGLAITDDGLNFIDLGFVLEADPGDGWDNKMSTFPGIWYEDGLYYLVYEGSGTENRGAVALATSEDGFTFEKKGIIVDYNHKGTGLAGANTGTPDIFKVDDTWYVTYHSFNWTDCQLCVAYGEDLMNLTLAEENPVIPTSKNKKEPDSGTTGRRDILYYDGWYYMVYEISSDQPYNEANWGHKFARTKDFINWEIADPIYPTTGGGMGNDGPAWLVIDGEVYVYIRTGSTTRYRLTLAE